MAEVIAATQLICLLFLAVGAPIVSLLRLRWRALAAEEALQSERSQRAALEQELEMMRSALPEFQLRRLHELRAGAGPFDNPPPGVDPVLAFARDHLPPDPYLYVFGWERVRGTPALVAASLHGDSPLRTNHGLITAKSDFGKDQLAFLIAWFLCIRATPRQLQLVWIDGTMSDGAFLRGLAHNWVEPVLGQQEVPLVMEALRLERERRDRLRVQHNVSKWEELPDDIRPPMLVIYVSELSVLELGCSDEKALEEWLITELTSARKAGIRYIIGSQTVANRKTRWRDQITWYCVGHQDTERAIQPNAGLTSAELEELGGWSPLRFPGPGYFTIRIGRNVATVRTPKVDLAERRRAVAMLPHTTLIMTIVDRLEQLRAEAAPLQRTLTQTPEPAATPSIPAQPHGQVRGASLRVPTETGTALNPAIFTRWEPQVRGWAGQSLSRRKMAEQMGIRHAEAFAIITAILGPAEGNDRVSASSTHPR